MSLATDYGRILSVAFGEESLVRDSRRSLVARGDSLLDEGNEAALESELPGVTNEAWTRFVEGMISAKADYVSPYNAVGMFQMSARRLADLGVVRKLVKRKSPTGKQVWVAVFVPPLTDKKFLRSPKKQYRIFVESVRNYAGRIAAALIEKDPAMSLSGALAILQRCGPSGLETWKDENDRFPATQAAYDKVAGLF